MQQLTELDYMFVQMESSRTPMHITPIIFYDQSALKGGKVRFKEILEVFERNLHKSKIFRRKLAGNTLGFDAPYWVEDPDFDLEFHVRHIALPKPGDWRQLCILMSRLHARGLDMSRPLWEAYVIEGLNAVEGFPPDSFAIMIKVHHCAIDGISGAEIIQAIHSESPIAPLPNERDDWVGEPDPSTTQVWGRAYVNNLKRPLKLVEAMGQLVPNLIEASKQKPQNKADEDAPLETTRFNTRVSSHRVTDTLIMDLDRLKAIRQAVPGATINDIVVSIVGGAMRKYLADKDELPLSSLSCGAPINLRAERNSESAGNQVGVMTIDMATDVEGALERLQAVMEHAGKAKQYTDIIGPGVMMEISRGLWPQFTNAALHAAFFTAARTAMPLPVHTVVSNVPGPQAPLYLAGAKVHMLMGMGPLLDTTGLFHAVISGAGKITINFVSCRELLPDPEFYQQCLQQSYDELEQAALPKKPKRKARRRVNKT